MSRIRLLLDKYPLQIVAAIASPIILLCTSVLMISLTGTSVSVFRFESTAAEVLVNDEDIAGWIEFDKDSYLLGEHASCLVRVLYRNDKVKPDLDAFKRNLGFLPFDQIGVTESSSSAGIGITEYRITYQLHMVGVKRPDTYKMDPAMLPYTNIGQPGSNLHTVRIPRPAIHIGSLYPWNAGSISLREIKPAIYARDALRQSVMLLGGTILLLLALFILWRFGRRRTQYELTVPEQLWFQLKQLNESAAGPRSYLLGCEKIVTRLLHVQIDMDPDSFWSGAQIEDQVWSTFIESSRQILRRVYQSGELTQTEVTQMKILLSDKLKSLVAQHRLLLELQPTLSVRIRQQPRVAQTLIVVTILSALLLVLVATPQWWLSSEIKRYNSTVQSVLTATDITEEVLLGLQSFASSVQNKKIQLAAYYNSGTARAAHSFGVHNPESQLKILELVFQAETPDDLLQTLILTKLSESEEDVIALLVNAAEKLQQAQLDLQSAARIDDNDDVLRNLELTARWRNAVLTRLVQLRDMFKMKTTTGDEKEIASDQGLINIIEAKLPEEYEDADSAKDNSSYIIFERF